MQLRSPTEQTFPSCPRPKQLVYGETMWAKHHMFPDSYDAKTEKEGAEYLQKIPQLPSHALSKYL